VALVAAGVSVVAVFGLFVTAGLEREDAAGLAEELGGTLLSVL
jgi:hypothetical protein